jgi:hypothetical protein
MALAGAIKTKKMTADGIVFAGRVRIYGVIIVAGADLVTAVLYDNASAASGDELPGGKAAANTLASWTSSAGVLCRNGIYLDVTGTSPVVHVLYG